MKEEKLFCIEVWGDYACFTRPEMKVERVSYDVITPSAARGLMAMRKLIIFKHESALGNAAAHKLFELVTNPKLKDESKPARVFNDYETINIPDISILPNGVSVSVID